MTIDNPLVSVIMLCYNHEDFVEESIQSIINQTYKNLEIIIVDNNSQDNSKQIITKYISTDNRIKYHPKNSNIFPSAGINFGISKSTGKYITMLSTDDYFESTKIEEQLQFMIENKFNNSFTWVNVVNSKSYSMSEHPLLKLFNRSFQNLELERFLIEDGNTLCAPSGMFNKTIFDNYGLFDHRLLQLQDYGYWIKLLQKEKIHLLERRLTNYRVRDDNNNLSLKNNDSVKFRTSFEYFKITEIILDLDLELLSKILKKECTSENKYTNLFNFYMESNKHEFAFSTLNLMHERLGNKFSFPSPLYEDFFKLYSKFDVFNLVAIESLKNEIRLKDIEIQNSNILSLVLKQIKRLKKVISIK